MIAVPAGVRVMVATKPVDFRRGATIVPNRLVHEDAVIVGVESEQCKREQFAQLGQCHRKYRLLAYQQRRAFRPAGSDIGQDQSSA